MSYLSDKKKQSKPDEVFYAGLGAIVGFTVGILIELYILFIGDQSFIPSILVMPTLHEEPEGVNPYDVPYYNSWNPRRGSPSTGALKWLLLVLGLIIGYFAYKMLRYLNRRLFKIAKM
jgi:hypothetical protein